MLADLYNCPVKTASSKEGPALGVAILALVGAGVYKTVPEACEKITVSQGNANMIIADTINQRMTLFFIIFTSYNLKR